MANASFTIQTKRQRLPTSAEILADAVAVMEAYRDIGVKHIKTVEWAMRRFKKPTGKSTNSWAGFVDKKRLFLTIDNTAVSRAGYPYPPVVHLAGRPQSERLVLEVEGYIQRELAPSILRAVNYAHLRKRASMPSVTTKIGG